MTALQAKDRRRLGLRSFAATKKTFWLTTMMLPGAVWLLLIRYLPMFGIVIAFKNYRAFRPNTFWNNIVKQFMSFLLLRMYIVWVLRIILC